jgi:hypothetical protein
MNNSAKICPSCGKPFIRNLIPESYLDQNCFDCSFWLEKITMPEEDENRRVIVAGQHYMVGANTSGPRGFGGSKYTIHFNDGRTVETCNLWYQGEIPEKFRAWLPDNARFIPNTKEDLKMCDFFDIEDWMIIGPLSEDLAEDERNQKQIEDDFDQDEDTVV